MESNETSNFESNATALRLSTSNSVYSHDIPEPTSSSRLFHVYYNTCRRNLTITAEDKTPVFFVKNRSLISGKNDVIFHAGQHESDPTVAVCKFRAFSADSKVGLGNPDEPSRMVWEDMTKETWNHSKYRWEMTIYPSTTDKTAVTSHGERKGFVWKRTHSVGIGDSMPRWLSARNFKLEDESTRKIIAVYSDNGAKSFNKCGKFQIDVDFGKDFDTMVLITGLALLEKERRRRQSGG
jgi:hypothetical protein